MQIRKNDVVIIGAGPAGISLALYLKRAKIDFILLEEFVPGGKLNQIPLITNYLGIKKISGSDLAISMFEQISELGIDIIGERAIKIVKIDDGFIVTTKESKITSKIIVIANGVSMKEITTKGFDEFYLNGISSCAVCDGQLYKNKAIAVIGNNETANKEYEYLKGLTKSIIRIDNKEEVVEEFIGEEKLSKIKTNKNIYDVKGAFIYDEEYIDYSLLSSIGLNVKNHRLLVNNFYETNINNIYAIGDAVFKPLYQIVGAINDASIASVSIINKLR